MSDTAPEVEHLRRVRARLRILQHYEVVTHNVSLTCRFFGISRSKFYFWRGGTGSSAWAASGNTAAVPRSAPSACPRRSRPSSFASGKSAGMVCVAFSARRGA